MTGSDIVNQHMKVTNRVIDHWELLAGVIDRAITNAKQEARREAGINMIGSRPPNPGVRR
jgi:hypothetical protein